MLPEAVFRLVCIPCGILASMEPLCELILVLYSRSGILDGSLRAGVWTRIEPEAVLRRRRAGLGADVEAFWRLNVMSMWPEVVWMERRS